MTEQTQEDLPLTVEDGTEGEAQPKPEMVVAGTGFAVLMAIVALTLLILLLRAQKRNETLLEETED